ncbi:MAG: hypothetical protein ACRC4W_00175 [Treponemataceae bacterium]
MIKNKFCFIILFTFSIVFAQNSTINEEWAKKFNDFFTIQPGMLKDDSIKYMREIGFKVYGDINRLDNEVSFEYNSNNKIYDFFNDTSLFLSLYYENDILANILIGKVLSKTTDHKQYFDNVEKFLKYYGITISQNNNKASNKFFKNVTSEKESFTDKFMQFETLYNDIPIKDSKKGVDFYEVYFDSSYNEVSFYYIEKNDEKKQPLVGVIKIGGGDYAKEIGKKNIAAKKEKEESIAKLEEEKKAKSKLNAEKIKKMINGKWTYRLKKETEFGLPQEDIHVEFDFKSSDNTVYFFIANYIKDLSYSIHGNYFIEGSENDDSFNLHIQVFKRENRSVSKKNDIEIYKIHDFNGSEFKAQIEGYRGDIYTFKKN